MNQLPSANCQTTEVDDFDEDHLEAGPRRGPTGQSAIQLVAFGLAGRWHWIVLGLILGLLGGYYWLAKTPQQYTATSSLLIKQQTTTVMARDQVDEIDLRSVEAMNTIVARIQSRELLERVASRQEIRDLTGLMQPPVDVIPAWLRRLHPRPAPLGDSWREVPPAAALGGMIKSRLGVSVVRGTRLIGISITHPDATVASVLADAVANEYVSLVASGSTQDRKESIRLLEAQSQDARASLRTTGSNLAVYARAIEACKALDAQELLISPLQRRYLPKHPKLIAATADLKCLQEEFICEFARANEATKGQFSWEQARKELPDSQSQSEEYLHAVRQQLLAYTGVLQSEIQSSTLILNAMLNRIQESSLNQKAEDFNAEISELANACGTATGPVARTVMGTGALGGLVGGLMLAVLFIRLDRHYHTVAQIANETGASILGAIAEIKPAHLAIAEKHYWKRHPGSSAESHETANQLLIFRPGVAATSYAEMYRSLYASVSRLGDVSQRKISIFSSALPGEGKTLTSANFAAVAASYGRKTLLIDLDLRKPAIHRFFGLPHEPAQGGITECLSNLASFEQVIQHPEGHPNLSLIVAGKPAANPGELLESGLLKKILAQACLDFDVIVLDSAPFLAVSDTRIIAPLVHNFCIVAKAAYVHKGAIRRVLEVMQADGIPLSGIVFNSYRECGYLKSQNYSYGYYRSAGYGRYSRYCYDSYGGTP